MEIAPGASRENTRKGRFPASINSVSGHLSLFESATRKHYTSLPFAFSTAAMKFTTSLVFLATASLSAAASIPSKNPFLLSLP